jgi:hypothetical protein
MAREVYATHPRLIAALCIDDTQTQFDYVYYSGHMFFGLKRGKNLIHGAAIEIGTQVVHPPFIPKCIRYRVPAWFGSFPYGPRKDPKELMPKGRWKFIEDNNRWRVSSSISLREDVIDRHGRRV